VLVQYITKGDSRKGQEEGDWGRFRDKGMGGKGSGKGWKSLGNHCVPSRSGMGSWWGGNAVEIRDCRGGGWRRERRSF